MKRLIYATTLILTLTSLIPAAYADESPQEYQKVTHFVHSAAHPNNAHIPNATHHFELYVAGRALSQISIELPDGIRIKQGIEVTDQSGKKVADIVSINNKIATIDFTQPVTPGNILSIEMKGITTNDLLGRAWLYQVSAKDVGIMANFPLGTAQINTYH